MGMEPLDLHHLAYDDWLISPESVPPPPARYKHAAAVVDEKLYITGGSRNGRYLSDVHVFDLRSFTWSAIKLNVGTNPEKIIDGSPVEVLLAVAGHSMIRWQNKLLLLAGHSKDISDGVTVRFIDLESLCCGVVQTYGKVPRARGGQSVTLFGSKLIMFGGEDRRKQLLNDVHILDLETMTWNPVEATQTPPAPRFDHTAEVHAERYLLIFGGCSHSIFFSDLHVLDLETMEWSQPQIQGDLVTPRAGHAGVAIGENWYMVGGGDNRSGVRETLQLNMSKLSLSVLASVTEGHPLASEGLSVSSASVDCDKFLVAFGGYNGRYSNKVHILRPKPRDILHPKIFESPAAAAAAASVTAAYALAKPRILDATEPEDSNYKTAQVNNSQPDLSVQINAIKEEKDFLESSLRGVTAENSALQTKIDDTNSTYTELSKELHSVQGQLVAERSRCATLETQIAELQKMLGSMQSIEEEVEVLRRQKSALDHDSELAATVQKQSSGGVWRWVAG